MSDRDDPRLISRVCDVLFEAGAGEHLHAMQRADYRRNVARAVIAALDAAELTRVEWGVRHRGGEVRAVSGGLEETARAVVARWPGYYTAVVSRRVTEWTERP